MARQTSTDERDNVHGVNPGTELGRYTVETRIEEIPGGERAPRKPGGGRGRRPHGGGDGLTDHRLAQTTGDPLEEVLLPEVDGQGRGDR